MILLLIFFACNISSTQAQEILLLSYNIRYDNPADGINNWDNRKEALCNQVKALDVDFIGVQEALWSQMVYLNNKLDDYKFIGVGRDDGEKAGEFSAIFYNPAEFEHIQSNTIWLSDNPKIMKAAWDAVLPRICTYGLFRNKLTRDSIWVFNTHFDHVGKMARKNSATQLVNLIENLDSETNSPIFLMGDFNATPSEEPIRILVGNLKDAYSELDQTKIKDIGTFNGFGTSEENRRIDYIFCKDCNFEFYEIIAAKKEDGLYFSDHFPILAKATF
jgi:endonuclease/exonuclease/phosphatase family metal-dependent hydrolase